MFQRTSLVLAMLLALVATAFLASPSASQVRGGVQVIDDEHTFSTSGQPMWGTGVSFDEGIDVFFDSGDRSGSFGAFTGDVPFRFGFGGSGGVRAVFGLQASASLTGGEVGVVFPMALSIRAPEPNSFRPGEEIMLTTEWVPTSGGAISSVAPAASFEVNSPFGIEATASAEACVFDCFDIEDLSVGFPEGLRTSTAPKGIAEELILYQMNAALEQVSIPVAPTPSFDLPYDIPEEQGGAIGVLGSLDLPRAALPCPEGPFVCTQDVASGVLSATSNHTFVDLDLDMDTWLILAIAKKNPLAKKAILGIEVPFDEAPFNLAPDDSEAFVEVFDGKFLFDSVERQEFRFMPNPRGTLSLPTAVQYRVVDGTTQVASGTGNEVPFQVGQTLFLTFPGSTNPLGVESAYDVGQNRFENRTSFGLVGTARFTALAYKVFIPDDLDESGRVWTESFPAFNEFFQIPTQVQTLSGFGTKTGTSFTLDPEDPCIMVSTDLEPGLLNGLGPAGTLVQTIEVTNCGDVRVLMTQVADLLSLAFPSLPGFTVNGISSTELATNSAWNGSGPTLAGTDELLVGQTSTISIEFEAEPGNIYHTAVVASGQSPIETPLLDSDGGSFAVYPLDYDIDKLNNAGGPRAVVPLHLLDTPALDVEEIDPTSLRIDGLAPDMWNYVLRDDVGPELDLAAFFDRREIWDRLQARKTSALAMGVSAQTGDVALSPPEVRQLAEAVLAGSQLPAGVAARADRIGNRNGRLDLGDLRAAATASRLDAGGPLLAKTEGIAVTLPLTGAMIDGTPFVAEDAIIVP